MMIFKGQKDSEIEKPTVVSTALTFSVGMCFGTGSVCDLTNPRMPTQGISLFGTRSPLIEKKKKPPLEGF